ncbi:MAG: AmmeMemoRadiSam system protein B [Rhodospirillales bacterium]|nr:AmmeMemoRadiSam system protein B [Rhodospirillales bacterium]
MTSIRQAAVAGQFYPGAARELTAAVERYLSLAAPSAGPTPKAIIAPHAGYVYSGPVAASAYARIRAASGHIHRVILLGPCHRVAVRGLALSSATAFATPLGNVRVDGETAERLLRLPQVHVFDDTHFQEHSLEVHLPFLQVILGDFALVPLVVGDATAEEVAEVLDAVWGGPETLIVVSSDLSHYLGYDAARQLDQATCRAIESLNPSAIGQDQACGRVPVGGLLHLARRRGLSAVTVDLRNSGDTAGPRDRVVGYGSWLFIEPPGHAAKVDGPAAGAETEADAFAGQTRALLARHGETLLHLAAASVEHGLVHGKPLPVRLADYAPDLGEPGASFVTLKRQGKLRGCIGTASAYQPLVLDVAEHAFAAAFRDPRFAKLTADETDGLSLSVSVLSAPSPIQFASEADLLGRLRPRVDGLIIEDSGRKALFLPAVWETLPDPRTFLGHLKIKAGLKAEHWSGGFKAWRFVAEEISDEDLADPIFRGHHT